MQNNNNDDLTLLSIRSAVDHMRSTINRALQRIERKQQLQNGKLFSEVKERRKLARELALDSRVVEIYNALVRQPKLELKQADNLLHCEISSAVVVHEGGDQVIKFKLNDNDYRLRYVDHGGATISFYGETFKSSHLSLQDSQGEQLLTLHLNIEGDDTHEQLTVTNISGFVPGRWVYDIIHAYETLVTTQRLKEIKTSYSDEKLDVLKRRFGIETLS